jgi:NTP pyrophosphatase (non-canonical NTP hydrolase)
MTENRSQGPYRVRQGTADKHFNGLTPAEHERLTMLAEECAEVIQAVTKIQRHGYESCNPFGPGVETNRERLLRELFDVAAVTGMISLDLPELQDSALVDQQVDKSLRRKLQFAHHQDEDFKEYLDVVNSL